MFMSRSGSFTWRKAWRMVSALSKAVVTPYLLRANLATRNTAHQTVSPPRDPGIDPASDRQHAGDPKERRQPPFPRQQPEQLGYRIGAREHPSIRQHQMHGCGERRQRDAEPRDTCAVLKRHVHEALFPIPPVQERDGLLTDSAFAVVDQRRLGDVSGWHRRRVPWRPRRAREPLSAS